MLAYHRVAVLERDPQLLAVSPANFDAQVRMLAECFHVMPPAELVSALSRRALPGRAVAVTFDDGYADNLLTAQPILRSYGVPAAVFVSTGHVDTSSEFWWDEIERIVLAPGTLPEHLGLSAGQERFTASLTDTVTYSAEDAERAAGWNVTQPDGDERQRLYRDLCEFVKPLGAVERESVLGQLRSAAGVSGAARETHRPLTAQEVRELDAGGLVEVGGHTVTHPVLSRRSVDEQREEIVTDRRRLGELCGREPRLFSYPFGGLDDFSKETSDIAREAGYDAAFANVPAVVKPWTDAFRIPRVLVRDWDADTLRECIEGWFDEPR
jgi:peptidoglycan/xylan/chitin deacetylase (PgdA/CDA1 family)